MEWEAQRCAIRRNLEIKFCRVARASDESPVVTMGVDRNIPLTVAFVLSSSCESTAVLKAQYQRISDAGWGTYTRK